RAQRFAVTQMQVPVVRLRDRQSLHVATHPSRGESGADSSCACRLAALGLVILTNGYVNRRPLPRGRHLQPQSSRLGPLLVVQPGSLVPPQTRAIHHLLYGPGVVVDAAPTPTVLHQEARSGPAADRQHVVIGLAAERESARL